jgi:hypothetical protein
LFSNGRAKKRLCIAELTGPLLPGLDRHAARVARLDLDELRARIAVPAHTNLATMTTPPPPIVKQPQVRGVPIFGFIALCDLAVDCFHGQHRLHGGQQLLNRPFRNEILPVYSGRVQPSAFTVGRNRTSTMVVCFSQSNSRISTRRICAFNRVASSAVAAALSVNTRSSSTT